LSVSPTSEPPLADFSSDNIEVETGQEVAFLCQSTGSITSRTWLFENGTPSQSNEINPVVTWNEAGTFNVSLEVENACGSNILLIENYITVNISYIQGDSNCDGSVNTLDVITTISYILGNNPQPFCFENADVNGDGSVNAIDVIGTINIILSGGFTCGVSTITDIDGNIYNTVLIGDQCWMKENLKTTQYRNGTPIEYPGTDNSAWQNNTTGAYAWYDNDINWKDS
jgi:PKD repeat protein